MKKNLPLTSIVENEEIITRSIEEDAKMLSDPQVVANGILLFKKLAKTSNKNERRWSIPSIPLFGWGKKAVDEKDKYESTRFFTSIHFRNALALVK